MKPKYGFTRLQNGINIHDDKKIGETQMNFQIQTQTVSAEAQKVLQNASLCYYGGGHTRNQTQDNITVPEIAKLTEERYVYAEFRALSQIFLNNRGLDFSEPGVLEAAVEMLKGKTVYPNHQFGDVNNWLGVVSESFWDAKGEKAGGVPGINCQIKIDAFLNYRIACGVMMNPPAVNSMSLTVLFEFEYSHPHMDRWKFWDMLGEEVDDEIVRLIVTNIKEIWEASLVPVGEDRLAKHQGNETDGEEESFSAANPKLPTNSNEEKKTTMKLTKEQKAKLGIEFDGEDVPETELFKAAESLATKFGDVNLADLQAKAKQVESLMTAKRAEVTTVAKLAELGANEGDLPGVLSKQIENADAETLIELYDYYSQKAADRFPAGGRSSVDSSLEVEKAGGVEANTPKPKPTNLL